MRENVIFEKIKEDKNNYIVSYIPMYNNKSSNNLASMTLTFIRETNKVEMIESMEKELAKWVKKYPVPTMINSSDNTDSYVYVKGSEDSHLIGWIDPISKQYETSWNLDKFPKYSDEYFKDGWDKIFAEISYKTQIEIKKHSDKMLKERLTGIRIIRLGMLVWFCVIPLTWLIIQIMGPEWVGGFITVFATFKILQKAKKIYFPNKNKEETPEELKRRMMEHYYYHCELNPKGFVKLKIENFNSEAQEKNAKELEGLKVKKA